MEGFPPGDPTDFPLLYVASNSILFSWYFGWIWGKSFITLFLHFLILRRNLNWLFYNPIRLKPILACKPEHKIN